jgi:hypothetical protein
LLIKVLYSVNPKMFLECFCTENDEKWRFFIHRFYFISYNPRNYVGFWYLLLALMREKRLQTLFSAPFPKMVVAHHINIIAKKSKPPKRAE